MSKELISVFNAILSPESIKLDEPMAKHTSFKIGGPADYFLMPSNVEELKALLQFLKGEDVPYYIMGNGSNLLVQDKGYRGVIIQIADKFNQVTINENIVIAQAGILLSKLSNLIAKQSLTGFEFASGIPGTLGGAICMNAGAYDGEMKDVLMDATLMNYDGEIIRIEAHDLELGYRTSLIQHADYIVLEATLRLAQGNQDVIYDKIKDLTHKRKTKQPLEYPSAGSAFKRPVGYYVGQLITEAGLKGYHVGDAMISDKHCGFIINSGCATAKDVLQLIYEIQQCIEKRYGILLEPEVRIIGEA